MSIFYLSRNPQNGAGSPETAWTRYRSLLVSVITKGLPVAAPENVKEVRLPAEKIRCKDATNIFGLRRAARGGLLTVANAAVRPLSSI